MARGRKIDTSGWEEEGRAERIDTQVASEVRRSGPEAYTAAYNAAKKLLAEEEKKSAGERKSKEEIRAMLCKAEPQYEAHNPERTSGFNEQVTIRNDVKRHLWQTHNQAVEDALAGKPASYQEPSIRLA